MIVTCPQCSSGMDAPALAAGKALRCPTCGHVFAPALPQAQLVDLAGDGPADADLLAPDAPIPPTTVVSPANPGAVRPPASGSTIPLSPTSQYVSQPPAPPGGGEAPPWAVGNYQPPKRVRDADALAQLAHVHEHPPEPDQPDWRGDPTMPRGWFIETASGDVGPFSSKEVSAAANLGLLGTDAMLKHHHKNVRLQAGNVPELFPDAIPAADPNAQGWYIEMPGQDMGPFTSNQIADAATRGQISPEIILKHPRKGLRLPAGDVPSLFKRAPAGKAARPAAQPVEDKEDTSRPDLAV